MKTSLPTPTAPTPTAHTPGPWWYEHFVDDTTGTEPFIIRGAVEDGGSDGRVRALATVILSTSRVEAEANARIMALAPDLLSLVLSAAVAFEERLSCLGDERQELVNAGLDDESLSDIDDQIGNYEALLAEHRKVLDQIGA